MENVHVLGLDRSLDAEARVEALVFEHEIKLARFVRRFVNEGDLALDIVQDVFFSAYRTLRSDPTRPLTAGWLYKTATNFSISYLRKKKRRGDTVPLDETAGPSAPTSRPPCKSTCNARSANSAKISWPACC